MTPLPWLIVLLLLDVPLVAYAVFGGHDYVSGGFGTFDLLFAVHVLVVLPLGTIAWFQLFPPGTRLAFLYVVLLIFMCQPLLTWPLALAAIIKILRHRRKSPTRPSTPPSPDDTIDRSTP